MVNLLKSLRFLSVLACLLFNTSVYAELASNTKAELRTSDPLLRDIVQHTVKNDLSMEDVYGQCTAITHEKSAAYHEKLVALLEGRSCRDLVEQLQPLTVDWKQHRQVMRAVREVKSLD